MSEPITSIRNLGPASERAFREAGIVTADELRALGPDDGYRRLLEAGSRPHFIGYYVLVMGLQGRPWNDCKGAEKAALRKRFDALVAEVRKARAAEGPSLAELDSALDLIGVGPKRKRPA